MGLLLSVLVLLGLAAIHIFAGKLHFLTGVPRSIWLSGAGGVSVAYVFLHLFPELSESQKVLEKNVAGWFGYLEHHVYLLALAGLAAFYGLERAVIVFKKHEKNPKQEREASTGIFWLHIASFSVYNLMLGYLIYTRQQEGGRYLILFFIAIGLHFLVNDFGLQAHHQGSYVKVGRWVLAASIIMGWCIGLFWEISTQALALLLAVLAGGIILNVLKEELPSERESNYWAFLAGAGGYSLLLLFL